MKIRKYKKALIKSIKTRSGADSVAKLFGVDKEFRTRVIPGKKKDYKIPSWE